MTEHILFATHYFSMRRGASGMEYIAGQDAAICLPLTSDNKILLIREVSSLPHTEYVYNFPGGIVDPNESPAQAANRELQEEIGFRACKLSPVGVINPWKYLKLRHHLFLAEDLVESKLEGDELFAIELVPLTLAEMENLVASGQITDATTILGFHLLRNILEQR